MAAGVIKLAIVGEAKKFKEALGEADASITTFSGKLSSIFQGIGQSIGQGLAGIASQLPSMAIQFGTDALRMATDMEAIQKTVGLAFGQSAERMRDWGKTTAKALGITEADSLKAASGFGLLFKSMGKSTEESAGLSQKLVEVAAAQARLRGEDPSYVLDAIAGAARGEYDMLQTLIPSISGAAVEQRALADTGKASASELTEQDKAMAALNLTIDGSADALAAWGETSDTTKAKQQELSARWADFQTQVGEQLLPVLSALTTVLVEDVMPAVEGLLPLIADGSRLLSGFTGFVRDNWSWLSTLAGGIVSSVVPAFDMLRRGIEVADGLRDAFNGFKDATSGLFDSIESAARAAFNGIRRAWNSTVGGFSFSLPSIDLPGLGKVGGQGFTIPSMASGGFAPAPMLALIGDNRDGSGEHVIGDRKLRQVIEEVGGGRAAPSVSINVAGNLDARLAQQLADEVAWRLRIA